jgi:putative AlgH/UPF0301 family transcriptional regulator
MNTQLPIKLPWLLVATPQLLDPCFKRKVVMIVEHGSSGSMGFILNQKARVPLSELVSVPYIKIPENMVAWMGGPVDRQSGVILAHRVLHHDVPKPMGMVCHPFATAEHLGSLAHHLESETTGYSLSSSEDSLIELVQYFQKQNEPPAIKHHDGAPQTQETSTGNLSTSLGKAGDFWEKQVLHQWSGTLPLAPTATLELYPFRFLIGYSGWAKGQLPGDPQLIFNTPWQELWHECMERVGVHPPSFAPAHQSLLH